MLSHYSKALSFRVQGLGSIGFIVFRGLHKQSTTSFAETVLGFRALGFKGLGVSINRMPSKPLGRTANTGIPS